MITKAFVARRRTGLLSASLFLILFGSRAALIHYAGNSTPFMDEWDGDAAFLIKPLHGDLALGDLVAPYNEHRIAFTRLLVLSILHVSGYWDVVLQMVVNAILDAATVVAIGYALTRVLSPGLATGATIACVVINAVPYGYDNALLGFNTHFYLLNAFAFASLWLLAGAPAWSARWAAGVFAAVCAYFCMASGALIPAAACAVHLLQAVRGRRGGRSEAAGMAALAGAAVVLLGLVPRVEASDAFKAHSVGQFLSAFLQLASWPAHAPFGLILFLPGALFLVRTLSDRPKLVDPRWVNVAALVWVLGAIVALAEGRAQWPLQSRYTGVLLIGSMVNLVSALWLFRFAPVAGARTPWRTLALAAWLAVFVLSLTHPQRHLRALIDERRDIAVAEARNLQGYLATGDAAFLAGPPALQIERSRYRGGAGA